MYIKAYKSGIFVAYDVLYNKSELYTRFLDDVRNAIKELSKNKIGIRAVDELDRLGQSIVIIPKDFFVLYCKASHLTNQEAAKLGDEYVSNITQLHDYQTMLNALELYFRSNGSHNCSSDEITKTASAIIFKKTKLCKKVADLEQKMVRVARPLAGCGPIKDDLFGNDGDNVTVDRLLKCFKTGSCFFEPTNSYSINLIVVDRNWNQVKKLFVDRDLFLSDSSWAEIKPGVDNSLGVTLFHELNHCRHFYRYRSIYYDDLTRCPTEGSSLGILRDRGDVILQGQFPNYGEELKLTGYIDINGKIVYDEICELNYRLAGSYHVRYPYADPCTRGRLYLSYSERMELKGD